MFNKSRLTALAAMAVLTIFVSACEREAQLQMAEEPDTDVCAFQVHINQANNFWIDGENIPAEGLEQAIASRLESSECMNIAASPLAAAGDVIRLRGIARDYRRYNGGLTKVTISRDESYD